MCDADDPLLSKYCMRSWLIFHYVTFGVRLFLFAFLKLWLQLRILVCLGRRIHTSGHYDFGILCTLEHPSFLTWVLADTASAACPSQSGNFATKSMTFAAVMCDADDPWSVNTACDPESSFTMSPRSTTLPLHFWNWGFSSEFLRWQRSINDAKCTILPSLLTSAITSFWFLTFVSCHASVFSDFSPILFPPQPLHQVFSSLEASE